MGDDTRVYYASRDKQLYALHKESGAEVWRVTARDIMTATPALHRDLVIFAAFDGQAKAVRARDGAGVWTYDARLAVPGDLVIDRDTVYLGSRSYDLIALEAASGRESWKHYYWFSWIESPPVVRNGIVYTGSSDATAVYAIDGRKGQRVWQTPVPGWAWAQPAVAGASIVAATVGMGSVPGVRNGALVAMDASSGKIRWVHLEPPRADVVQQRREWGFGAAPLIVEGTVYAADLEGRVQAIALGI